MPKNTIRAATQRSRDVAPVFAALGDRTRLALVSRLSHGLPTSIAQLSDGTGLTRQAVTKHLKVLQGAGLVRSSQKGRETLFELEPAPIDDIRQHLDFVSRQWDEALARLKAHIEG